MNEQTKIIFDPGKEYCSESRRWQGVPSIEKTGNRLWAAWFSGGNYEPSTENYAIIAYSDDDGANWLEPYMVIAGDRKEGYRVFDPQLWVDNSGKLWLFWCQDTYAKDAKSSDYNTQGEEIERAYFCKLQQWAMCCEKPEKEIPVWSKSQFMWSGLTKNNVEILKNGRWLVSAYDIVDTFTFSTKFMVSDDEGYHFIEKKGQVESTNMFCEPMTVQLNDGTLWCLIRTMTGYLDESFSYDNGETWTAAKRTDIPNPSTRFFIGRLKNGMLLLVNTPSTQFGDRKSLVASLSMDEGKTWKYHFKIDDRRSTTYPDVALDDEGYIYIIYDCQRDNRQIQDAAKEICYAKITADDIIAGELVSEGSCLQRIISKVQEF